MDAARGFYVDVLGAAVVAEQGGGRFLWIRLADREILLRVGDPGPVAATYDGCGIGLVAYSSDLDVDVRRLQDAGVQCAPMPGERGCYSFQDPDGHWWQLVDPDHG
jgi:catechol 2,3-dioxygenase-like lactoylglutathione lyase family enzyme